MKQDRIGQNKEISVARFNRRQIIESLGIIAGLSFLSRKTTAAPSGQNTPESVEFRVSHVATLIEAQQLKTVQEGDLIKTQGYYTPGDGGAAGYLVVRQTKKTKVNNGDIVRLHDGYAAILTGVTHVDYKMFGVIGNSGNDDGIQIKLAHDYANRHNLPVVNTSGEYWIDQTRDIQIKTSVQWGNSIFHIDEKYNTSLPVFRVSGYRNSKKILAPEAVKKSLIEGIKPGTQEIPELKDYKNSLILIRDTNDLIRRYGPKFSGQSKAKEELFYIEEDGRILGDIAYTFNDYTDLIAYPTESSYLTIEGGSFHLSGNPPLNTKDRYLQNGFLITRSRTIIKNQWVGLENGKKDIAMNPRNGFYTLDTIFDVTLENIRLLPWEQNRPGEEQDVPSGTYGIGGNRWLYTIFRNITAEGTLLHWGVFGTNMNKNCRIENCRLNRVDVHFHCWNLTITNSHIGNKGITVTGGGELIIENTTCDHNRFVYFRKDYGAKWDGNIVIKNCRLRPYTPSETSILHFVAANFNYGYPIGLAKSIFVENFVVDFKSIPNCNDNCWLITSSAFSVSKQGKRSFFPNHVQFKNIFTEGREKGVRLMRIPDPQKILLSRTGAFDGTFFKSNASLLFDNIQLERHTDEEETCYHLQFDMRSGYSYDQFSLYPKIHLSNCPSVSVHLGKACADIYFENCVIHRVHASTENPIPCEMTFANCKFLPVTGNDRIKPFQLSTELGTTFINCVFHLPCFHQEIDEEALSLIDFIQINKSVSYNHINSRLGKDIITYLKSKNIELKPDFISMLKSHHELDDNNL